MTCTFFGEAHGTKDINDMLRNTITTVIENYTVDTFYVGNRGSFNKLVYRILKELEKDYGIKYRVVTTRMLCRKHQPHILRVREILPDDIKRVSYRLSKTFRNLWMITQSDIVVTHVISKRGEAAEFKSIAEERGKFIINIL